MIYGFWDSPSDHEVLVNFDLAPANGDGDNLFAIGNVTQLGDWSIPDALPLDTDTPDADVATKRGSCHMEPGTTFEYRYFRGDTASQPSTAVWDQAGNTSESYAYDLLLVLLILLVHTCSNYAGTSENIPSTSFVDSNSGSGGTASTGNVIVTFNELATTVNGETIWVFGSIPELGNWDFTNAVQLEKTGYTNTNPLWSTSIQMAQGTPFQYKYVRLYNGVSTPEGDQPVTQNRREFILFAQT